MQDLQKTFSPYIKVKTKHYKHLVTKRGSPPVKTSRQAMVQSKGDKGRGKLLKKTMVKNCTKEQNNAKDVSYMKYLDSAHFNFNFKKLQLLLSAVNLKDHPLEGCKRKPTHNMLKILEHKCLETQTDFGKRLTKVLQLLNTI